MRRSQLPWPGRRVPRRASTMGTSVTVVMPEAVALTRDLAGRAMESAIARLTPEVRAVAA
jgi:hypothetical protein